MLMLMIKYKIKIDKIERRNFLEAINLVKFTPPLHKFTLSLKFFFKLAELRSKYLGW